MLTALSLCVRRLGHLLSIFSLSLTISKLTPIDTWSIVVNAPGWDIYYLGGLEPAVFLFSDFLT